MSGRTETSIDNLSESSPDEMVKLLFDPFVSSLFATHPNQVGAHSLCPNKFVVPEEWKCWWDWASSDAEQWKKLVMLNDFYSRLVASLREPTSELATAGLRHDADQGQRPFGVKRLRYPLGPQLQNIPMELQDLIWHINSIIVPRDMDEIPSSPLVAIGRSSVLRQQKTSGMTPKKAHEVDRLGSYIGYLLSNSSRAEHVRIEHVVDVGAGQGYLSRALYHLPESQLATHSSDSSPSRILAVEDEAQVHRLHVLALDSSSTQTAGAKRRLQSMDKDRKPRQNVVNIDIGLKNDIDEHAAIGSAEEVYSSDYHRKRSLTHRTAWIGAETTDVSGRQPGSLANEINEWLCSIQGFTATENQFERAHDQPEPTPILLVALHACGSLTPNILRSTLASIRSCLEPGVRQTQRWYVAAAVVVGCCYNLLDSQDFPLSDAFRSSISNRVSAPTLTTSHLQLAAQVPTQWFRTTETTASAALALKKVVFRALLEGYMQMHEEINICLPADRPDMANEMRKNRLGKLNNRAYETFDTFLQEAGAKMKRTFAKNSIASSETANSTLRAGPEDNSTHSIARSELVRRLEVLHVLRCLLGPIVESVIIQDRYYWLKESLASFQPLLSTSISENPGPKLSKMGVKLVNIFDQAMDSGRNVGIVIAPETSFAPVRATVGRLL